MSQHLPRLIPFAHAAREGSFSRAAQRLGVSQSAVSQQVARLEADIGQTLLIREREGLRLTATGQELFDLAEPLLTLATAVDERISGLSRLDEGHLSIIANSPRPALGAIGRFKALYPGVQISFRLWDWTTSMRLVRDRQCDIAFLTEPKGLGDCIQYEMERVPYVAYLPHGHPLSGCEEVTFSQLSAETVLLPEEGSFTRRLVGNRLQSLGLSLPKVISTATFSLMQDAVLHGVGVGIFLDGAAHHSLSLPHRPISELPERYATQLVHAKDKTHLHIIRAFIETAIAPCGPKV